MNKESLRIILYDSFIMLLTFIGLFYTDNTMYFILSSGLLLMIFSYSYFADKKLLVTKIILGIIFAILADFALSFLIFIVIDKLNKTVRGALSIICFLIYGIMTDRMLPWIIIDVIIILICLLLAMLIEFISARVLNIKLESEDNIKRMAISELHTKMYNKELIQNRFLTEKNARLLEREDISRNIHNSVGHSITAAIMTLDAADMLYEKEPEQARNKMNQANERMRLGLEAIRRAVRVLDIETKDVSGADFKESLTSIADEFMLDRNVNVYIYFDKHIENMMINHEHFEFLTGAFKEILTNGEKHGGANEYIINVSGDTAHIQFDSKDNGQSDFDDKNGNIRIENGFGIKKMMSYVEHCGGTMLCENNNGFHVRMVLPINWRK